MNRIRLLLVSLLLLPVFASAQFDEVPSPYNGGILAFENRGNSLLVVDRGDSLAFNTRQIALRWVNENGTIKSSIKGNYGIEFDTLIHINSVTQSGNDVYVNVRGYIAGFERDRVFHYDTASKTWTVLNALSTYMDGNLGTGNVYALKAFDGNLVVAGGLFDGGSNNRILTYFPTGDSVDVLAFTDTAVKGLHIQNGVLYAWGYFTISNGTVQTGGLLSFPNSTTWQDPFTFDNNTRYEHVSWLSNTEMLIQDISTTVSYLNNGTLTALPQIGGTLNSAVRFGNRLFVTSENSTSRILVYEDLIKDWAFVDTSDNFAKHHLAQVNNSLMHVSLNSTFHRTKKFTRLGAILKTHVYLDANENCQRDANELAIPGIFIHETSGAFGVLTNQDGRSFQYVNPGSYYMDTIQGLNNLTRNTCTSDTVEIGANDDTVYYEVPLKFINPNMVYDADLISVIGFRARQGFTERYTIRVKNRGAQAKACDFYIRIPDDFHRVNLSVPIIDSVPKRYKFQLNLNPGQETFINLDCKIPVNLPARTWHEFELYSDSSCGLEIMEKLKVEVRGAYDPNDKQSSEKPLMPKDTKKLRYHIRFQNTGSDTAYRVRIIDTVDRNLAMNAIRVKTASHAHRIEVLHQQGSSVYALHFIFDNILLPDSTTDEQGSHGYVQYEVALKNGFSDKDTVFNTAHIFFDYQSAIITNTVENSFDTSSPNYIPPSRDYSHLIDLYPNPSSSLVHIKNNLGRPINLVITDTRGRIIGYSHCGPLSDVNFNCETLAPGIYYMTSTDKLIRKRFVVVKD